MSKPDKIAEPQTGVSVPPPANDNPANDLPNYSFLPGHKPRLEIELKMNTREVCVPVAEYVGIPLNDEDRAYFCRLFSTRLRGEILAQLVKQPPFGAHVIVSLFLKTAPDISQSAASAIKEFCIRYKPVMPADVQEIADSSAEKLQPIIEAYRREALRQKPHLFSKPKF